MLRPLFLNNTFRIRMIDARKTWTERMSLSAIRKYNTENATYSYKSAILLEALYRAYKVLGDERIFRFVKDMLDHYVPEDGVVRTYDLEAYSMDQVRMGNIMLSIYDLTGEKKY